VTDRWVRVGSRAWVVLAVVALAAVTLVLIARLSLVLVPLVLALFPAALLSPAAGWLKRTGAPPTLVALTLMLTLGGALAACIALIIPPFLAQLPALGDAATQGAETVENVLQDSALPFDLDLQQIRDTLLEDAGGSEEVVGRGLDAARGLAEALAGLLLGLVALFFYLRDGRRLWSAGRDLLPARAQAPADELAERVWWTLGAYFRGQLLVALFDAVLIGLGLLLLGVPLTLPLAILVFLGGLFPIVGAFASGLAAVLVALADQGLTTAMLVLALVVVVQQIEGNLLEPLILSRAIALHPLTVIVSVTAGGVLLGVLGAFLAVPVAASVARVLDFLRGRRPPAGPGSKSESDGSPEPGSTARRG
jgi:predicted PurR-regulated permease PerM